MTIEGSDRFVAFHGELWAPVDDGFYEASTHGRIRRAKPGISTYVGRIVYPTCGPTGYVQVQLRTRRTYVHCVIAEAFLGPRPQGFVVNHKDGDRQNNALANLEYASQRSNVHHALRMRPRRRGPRKPRPPLKGRPTGDAHWSRRMPERVARGEGTHHKVKERDVRCMRGLRAFGCTVEWIADKFSLSIGQTSRVLRGLRWRHV